MRLDLVLINLLLLMIELLFQEKMEKEVKEHEVCNWTLDGAIDSRGHPAVRDKTGAWFAGILILGITQLTLQLQPIIYTFF